MTELDKVLYTAKAHTTGGRDGASRSSDGRLDVKLSSPGAAGGGTNPEQLFTAQCFAARTRSRGRTQGGGCGASDLPLFAGDARQYRCGNQRDLSWTKTHLGSRQ
jgi:hypothetical protein